MLFLIFLALPAFAQGTEKTYPTIKPAPQILTETGRARVINVIDALRLQLDDNRIIELSGLDIPDLYQQQPGDMSIAAKNLLEEVFLDQKVIIYQSTDYNTGRTNRMGHHLAHMTLAENDLWAQGALIESGLARVRTTIKNRALAKEMYELEEYARQNSPDVDDEENLIPYLWRYPEYAVLNEENVEKAPETFQIVEGTIEKVAINNNVYYLNFGANWRNDFTVSIPSSARRTFSKEGYAPLEWGGKTVRVRGWLEEYNGPHIEVDHPERIEFIEPEETAADSGEFAVPPTDKEIIKDALPNIENSGRTQ